MWSSVRHRGLLRTASFVRLGLVWSAEVSGAAAPSLTTWSRTGEGALLDLQSHNMDFAGKLKCEDLRAADSLPRTGIRAPSFIR